jgi:hypothetical protein
VGRWIDGSPSPVSPNPWATLPRGLYKDAAGVAAGWGTICDALNGSIAVMGILGAHGTLGNALVDYFANSPLPTGDLIGYDASGTVTKAVDVGSSVSYSPLCHNSVSSWGATVGVASPIPATPRIRPSMEKGAPVAGAPVEDRSGGGGSRPGGWISCLAYPVTRRRGKRRCTLRPR